MHINSVDSSEITVAYKNKSNNYGVPKRNQQICDSTDTYGDFCKNPQTMHLIFVFLEIATCAIKTNH